MKRFSLWLQEEVNTKDINEYLNQFYCELNKLSNVDLKMIESEVEVLLNKNINLEEVIEKESLTVTISDLIDLKVHAMYNPNDQAIKINKKWYEFLLSSMSEEMAYTFIVSHEVSHSLETDLLFKDFKRRKRNSALELMSLLYSMKYSNVEYHPFIYEYKYGLVNGFYSEEDLVEYLKGN